MTTGDKDFRSHEYFMANGIRQAQATLLAACGGYADAQIPAARRRRRLVGGAAGISGRIHGRARVQHRGRSRHKTGHDPAHLQTATRGALMAEARLQHNDDDTDGDMTAKKRMAARLDDARQWGRYVGRIYTGEGK